MSEFRYMTPCYIIDSDIFSSNLADFHRAFAQRWRGKVSFGYSIKTNHSPVFLKLAKQLGMFAESVSDDEYYTAIQSGYEAKNMIINGPQKTGELLSKLFSLECIINLDNAQDIACLKEYISKGSAVKARVGLRVNFDLESCCPGETTAGQEVSRFGFCVENGDLASAIEELHHLGIAVSGFHMHYSSKTRSERIFQELAKKAAHLVREYDLNYELTYVDIGGGFFYGKNVFAHGKPSLDAYAQAITEELKRVLDPERVELILEPGAALVSSAVTYHTKVINQRFVRDVNVLTVDGSRLHIDPFMTGRKVLYDISYSGPEYRNSMFSQIICGSTCMENDRIAYLDGKAEIKPDDVINCQCVGAYTMGFNSCFINVPPYVYLKQGNNVRLVRDRNRNLSMQM